MNIDHNIYNEEISIAAYYIWNQEHSYENLCWFLAERQLYVERNFTSAKKDDIRDRAYYIYKEHPPYDILCWFIGELDLYIKRNTSFRTFNTLFSK
ncbi:MAG: hypothetical protein BAJALOKI3v1_1100015 [Promethearchaeota archaeon]|jgi:hypothetical protein|nr:MAG: hypothetical protein BAJALOKI3v1_1100015 [Candidatus Lokiarchaeota archaeon]